MEVEVFWVEGDDDDDDDVRTDDVVENAKLEGGDA